MLPHRPLQHKSLLVYTVEFFFIALGATLAAFALEVFLFPNKLIDGGVVGLAMLFAYIFGKIWFSPLLFLFNFPFLLLAWRSIGKSFVMHMLFAVLIFSTASVAFHVFTEWAFYGEMLEVVVIGGAILGVGLGLIIRFGGGMDGTEILGIIISKRTGFTVGQVVLFTNVFVFGAYGLVFQDWHPPLLSLITYMVVIKIMDAVIVGLDETKSVWIISSLSRDVGDSIMKELGLGLTVVYGRGGFSGDEREILYVIAERLQLAELKELVYSIDPHAFIAIENLHEIANGNQGRHSSGHFSSIKRLYKQFSQLFYTPKK